MLPRRALIASVLGTATEGWSRHHQSPSTGTVIYTSTGAVVPLGAYCGVVGIPGFNEQWDGLTAVMERAPTLNLTYLDQNYAPNNSYDWVAQGRYFAGLMANNVRTRHTIPILGVPFGYNSSSGPVNLFSAMASGAYDTLIQNLLGTFKAAGFRTMYLRPAWEFNIPNNYAVSSQNASAFIAAWHHFYTIVHSYAASNGMSISVIWNPNVGINKQSRSLSVASQYPGNAYVDVIGIDTYGAPIFPGNDPTKNTTDQTLYLVTTMIAMGKANSKPIAVCEVGGLDTIFASSFVSIMAAADTQIAFIALWDPCNDPSSWSDARDGQRDLCKIWANALGAQGSIRS